MKAPAENTKSNEGSESIVEGNFSSSLIPKILSGSVGSIVTALAVTPLEVVKIRQQSAVSHTDFASRSQIKAVEPCPRGCTVVFNNGLMECVVPKSSIFDVTSPNFSRSFNSTQQTFLPRYTGGTLHTLSSICHYEGIAGLYAGLRPTLLMSVPNTVLYFTVYDEISLMLRQNHVQFSKRNSAKGKDQEQVNRRSRMIAEDDAKCQTYIPLVAGSTARLLASLATAPLELIRTRQASILPSGEGTTVTPGMIEEFRAIVGRNGFSSLYVGLAPTLWRDVPFSAVYWMCLERFKNELYHFESLGKWSGSYYENQGGKIPPGVEALHAFISGAAAGSIAAALTTPFDVVKTRRQMVTQIKDCSAGSAVGYGRVNLGLLGHMQQIVKQEGMTALWKGNITRMVKVAPACAIMISCYEFGKRAFGSVL
ncbi:hypothetical protein HJC23_004828 [Cyclotella cryptica]|uniref:Mitochondrial carrier protein n=1 Tax=Cyclotella cryptica TaxID=29204 RepID=A0ABD3P6W8_9STRA|eukprot:CCRYP_017048-RA/>CCRYP_017048-RA protein AED:0.06 eAED:0.06 QI:0/-1/0/1/-1/1/1/0/423